MPTRPTGVALPNQPATLAALQAMQSIVLSECLVGGVSPFAALSAADASRYGVPSAVFIGRPKDFADAYLPQCCIWGMEGSEVVEPVGVNGRAHATLAVCVQVFVDLRTDWWAAEQQILGIRDAILGAMAHHTRLGGTAATVMANEAHAGRGLCYEPIAGTEYRCYEAIWELRQQWALAGGRTV
ncbi:MAG TPA: hypothetical protein VF120_16460 [Ktedonobacterales bacterium]